MASGLQQRRGRIYLWRLGKLAYGEQSRWDRAPARRGMWAFPYPYMDSSFIEHQYAYYMPKRLRFRERSWDEPLDPSWYSYPDGSRPAKVELDEYGCPVDYRLCVRQDFYDARARWIEETGRRCLPLRRFWYEGDVYTHFPRTGLSVSEDNYWELLQEWHRVPAEESFRRLRKATGQLNFQSTGGRMQRRDMRAGVLELFLPEGAGRVS